MKANLIIRASAGTGKTFSLATRFIRLMAFDRVRPERIVALTFSRAAAQEIYAKLLERLWKAASSETGAEAERGLLLAGLSDEDRAAVCRAGTDLSRAGFARILRQVVDAQEVGAIATLDSFILRIVRSFPLEMGFQHAVDVLDGYGETSAVSAASDRLLERVGAVSDTLAEDFHAAQRGVFTRTCRTVFGRIVSGWRAFLQQHPEAKNWTADSMCAALGVPANPCAPVTEGLAASGNNAGYFAKFCEHLKRFDGAGPVFPDNKLGEMMRFFADHPEETVWWYDTSGKRPLHKVCDCGPEGARAVREGVACLIARKVRAALEVLAAKLRLAACVEADYDRTTRRQGRLTFSDFTRCQAVAEDSDEGLRIENIQFRFDERFDHWALDEFQDTSALQWLCLKRLVREAADDPERSVMVVGDLKQSIYAWRGGDDEPFLEIMNRWAAFTGERGEQIRNDVSYRYEKNTADFVNRVFGPANLRHAPLLGGTCGEAVRRWLSENCWMEHRPDTRDGVPRDGDYVELVAVPAAPAAGEGASDDAAADGDNSEDGDEAMSSGAMRILAPKICELAKDLWRRHEACEGGPSTDTLGILVRNNRDGAYLAERLRSVTDGALPVVWEGADGVLDEPVVRAILQLLALAVHPEDTFAWKVVNGIFPLRERVFPLLTHAATVSEEVSRMLSSLGLSRTLRDIVARVAAPGDVAPRLTERLEALVRAAARFETREDGAHALEDFPKYLAATAGRELAASPHVIRILTIHRSKGLTLDHVIVPILERGSAESVLVPRKGTVLSGDGWAFEMDEKDVVRRLPKMSGAYDEAANARLLEQLRLHYVALSRARKSTYVFYVDEPHGQTVQFRDLLAAPFTGEGACLRETRAYGEVVYRAGTPFRLVHREETRATTPVWSHAAGEPVVPRRTPSTLRPQPGTVRAAPPTGVFDAAHNAASERGLARHAFYQTIEWADAGQLEALPENVRDAFRKPSAEATVWRERDYELFDGTAWETGRFDRVVFTGSGATRAATIYDFKTNARRADETPERFAERMAATYAPQMAAYRRALAILTGIPEDKILTKILLEDDVSAETFALQKPKAPASASLK